jgi:hypothetical protein
MRKKLFVLLAYVLATALIVPTIVMAGPPPHTLTKIPWNRYTVLDPRGWQPGFFRIPLSPRLDTLEGKTIVVMVDPEYKHGYDTMVAIRDGLESEYPTANIVWVETSAAIAALKPANIDALAVGAGT